MFSMSTAKSQINLNKNHLLIKFTWQKSREVGFIFFLRILHAYYNIPSKDEKY